MSGRDGGFDLGALQAGSEGAGFADEEGGTGRGGAFLVGGSGCEGDAFEESSGGGRGDRHDAVGAFYGASPDLEGGAGNAVDAEQMPGDGGTYDIDNGIEGPDFMEVHRFRFNAMHGRLRFREGAKAGEGILLDGGREGAGFNGFANFAIGTVMGVPGFVVVTVLVVVIVIEDDLAAEAADAAALSGFELERPTGIGEFAQFGFEGGGVYAERHHCSEIHIAADSGGAMVVQNTHRGSF